MPFARQSVELRQAARMSRCHIIWRSLSQEMRRSGCPPHAVNVAMLGLLEQKGGVLARARENPTEV
jgi:hypothetical protein